MDQNLVMKLAVLPDGESLTAKLEVDDRVMARITDGIYRQPSSALRELISNAYDADATQVSISTDAPRFSRVVVRDNGSGMSPEVLAYLITHIGGSSKRTAMGQGLGTVRQGDVARSPGGRTLIGKIGIGLFAVSHLTQYFQIITKQKNDNFRTSAVVSLLTHSEEGLAYDPESKFQAGSVELTKEPTSETSSHGTEIILMNLRASTRKALASIDRWTALDHIEQGTLGSSSFFPAEPPVFHIGQLKPDDSETFLRVPNLPWEERDEPVSRFEKLFEAVSAQKKSKVGTPTLESSLDNYLQMVWTLAVGVPVRYVGKHPFEVSTADRIDMYLLSNDKKGQAQLMELPRGETLGGALSLKAMDPDPLGDFRVTLDGIELRHPIRLENSEPDEEVSPSPSIFVGRCRSPLHKVAPTLGGGALEFEGYFYWSPVIVPKDNNGVLVRIYGATGMLFDETFLDYRVSELTRLRQITAEIYILRGMDPALNIDRESFNTSHPHFLYVREWIHKSLRQVTNRLKAISKESLDQRRREKAASQSSQLEERADQVWAANRGTDIVPPVVLVSKDPSQETEFAARERGAIVLDLLQLGRATGSGLKWSPVDEARTKSLVTVLDAYGLIDDMSYEQLHALIRDINYIFEEGRKN